MWARRTRPPGARRPLAERAMRLDGRQKELRGKRGKISPRGLLAGALRGLSPGSSCQAMIDSRHQSRRCQGQGIGPLSQR